MSKHGDVSCANSISYTGKGSALSEFGARYGGEGQVNSQGTDWTPWWEGDPAAEAAQLLLAGLGTVCRTESPEMTGGTGGAVGGMRSRLAQGLCDQGEQCFSTKSVCLAHWNIPVSSWLSKWGTGPLCGRGAHLTFRNRANSRTITGMCPGHRDCRSIIASHGHDLCSCRRCFSKKLCTSSF